MLFTNNICISFTITPPPTEYIYSTSNPPMGIRISYTESQSTIFYSDFSNNVLLLANSQYTFYFIAYYGDNQTGVFSKLLYTKPNPT